MKERGMIFNGEMVRAILDGRKTQTRRIIQSPAKNMQASGQKIIEYREPGDKWYGDHVYSMRNQSGTWCDYTRDQFLAKCPFGAVGDRIWVRETYQGPLFDYEHMEAYLEDSSKFEKPDFCVYRADGKPAPEFYDADDNLHCCWRPSIHMPRWASRILLEITGVRVELLNKICEGDAQAEGVAQLRDGFWKHYQPGWTQHQLSARGSFVTLWKSIYGEESWNSNPWVWVIEFKRIDGGVL